jgi:hypothetical protein
MSDIKFVTYKAGYCDTCRSHKVPVREKPVSGYADDFKQCDICDKLEAARLNPKEHRAIVVIAHMIMKLIEESAPR